MERRLFLLIVSVVYSFAAIAQTAQKPIVMVVPEKAWCIQKGYTKDGKTVDYEKALLNNDVLNAVTRMGAIMAERGYPLKLLSATLDAINNEGALDIALRSKGDGEMIEDDLDQLLRVANADIMVNIAFNRQNVGPRSQIEFRVTGVDAATLKQITGNIGRSSASGASFSTLVDEAVSGFMDSFSYQLLQSFQNTVKNGREGTFVFKIASDCPLNFESEVNVNGESGELAEFIEYWISEHAVSQSFTQGGKSRVRLSFEQVHFPLFGKSGFGGRQRAINAEGFIRSISKDLANLGISVSTTPIGIGKVYVVLGRR
jgi:hypothetical protein